MDRDPVFIETSPTIAQTARELSIALRACPAYINLLRHNLSQEELNQILQEVRQDCGSTDMAMKIYNHQRLVYESAQQVLQSKADSETKKRLLGLIRKSAGLRFDKIYDEKGSFCCGEFVFPTNLSGFNLACAQFGSGNSTWINVDFTNSLLLGASFESLSGHIFNSCLFFRTNMQYVQIPNATITKSKFDGVDLTGANLCKTVLTSCPLTFTRFYFADLTSASILYSPVDDVSFDGACFDGTKVNIHWEGPMDLCPTELRGKVLVKGVTAVVSN